GRGASRPGCPRADQRRAGVAPAWRADGLASAPMSVEIGQEAPDFEKRASTGDTIRLSSYRGDKAVALVFHPFTFTGVCHGELCELRDDLARYEAAGVQVLAISCDTAPAQAKW